MPPAPARRRPRYGGAERDGDNSVAGDGRRAEGSRSVFDNESAEVADTNGEQVLPGRCFRGTKGREWPAPMAWGDVELSRQVSA
jgi:hypothetical protein